MWLLIYKDVYPHMKWLLMYIVGIVGNAIIFTTFTDGQGLPLILAFIGAMMGFAVTQWAAHLEDKQNGLTFLNAMPISRATIVCSKFVLTLIFTFVGFVLAYFLTLLCTNCIGLKNEGVLLKLVALPSLYMLVMQGFYWVLFFRFNYIRAQNVIRILIFIPVFLFLIPMKKLGASFEGLLFSNTVFFSVLAATILIYLVSMKTAQSVFIKKDIA